MLLLAIGWMIYFTLFETWLRLHHLRRSCIRNENSQNFSRQEALQWVQRRIHFLSIIIKAAPLTGLLGTVVGMLQTFDGLSGRFSGTPIDAVASGISQALISTQLGLMIAIPALFLIVIIRGQYRKLAE